MPARGIRNNNPGNIRLGAADWKGMATDQTDGAFVTFTRPEWGIRAIVRILRSYERRGLKTVRQMINRWAPPTENDTDSYVDHVAQAVGVDPDVGVDLDTVLVALVEAIVKQENGSQPYPVETIQRGIDLA
jgi:hypothetical protein